MLSIRKFATGWRLPTTSFPCVVLMALTVISLVSCSPSADDSALTLTAIAAVTPSPVATVVELTEAVPNHVDMDAHCATLLPGASDPDETGCGTRFDVNIDLTFDDDLHRAWYARFWTGSCEGVRAFCLPGISWHQTIDTLLGRMTGSQVGHMRNRLWALGRAVGFDWARDNQIGTITTGDLQQWGQLLDSARTERAIFDAVEQIEEAVCVRLGREVLQGSYTVAPSCQ